MDTTEVKDLPYDELRALYRVFLHSQNISKATINTAYADTFYLWRKGSKELFWDVVTSNNFEDIAKNELVKALSESSTGNVSSNIGGYLSHLRRFRLFLASNEIIDPAIVKKQTPDKQSSYRKKTSVDIPYPSPVQVMSYLEKWNSLENYRLQEDALNKLFFDLCPKNVDVTDILLKISTLNDFYSTNIFSVYPVAKHICALDIDVRLEAGDVTLVSDIQYVTIGDTVKNFYSFASKYCSHHKPLDYPIYDNYVKAVLCCFRNHDDFADFHVSDLKNYAKFKGILIRFSDFYGLNQFNLKQVDRYLWLLGKEYFPKNYSKQKETE